MLFLYYLDSLLFNDKTQLFIGQYYASIFLETETNRLSEEIIFDFFYLTVDKKEHQAGHDPERELKDSGFHDVGKV